MDADSEYHNSFDSNHRFLTEIPKLSVEKVQKDDCMVVYLRFQNWSVSSEIEKYTVL